MAADSLSSSVFAELDRLAGDYDQLALAVSGGPDSTAMAILCADWAVARGKPPPLAFIIDHGIRADSGLEAGRVAKRLKGAGLKPVLKRLPAFASKPSQAKMRMARYEALSTLCQDHQAQALVLGHHQDDHIETLLERLSRSSDLIGLAGLWDKRFVGSTPCLRPLLKQTKQELIAYLDAKRIKFETDPSNKNLAYARGRWRQARPGLETEAEALLGLSSSIQSLIKKSDQRITKVLASAVWRCETVIEIDMVQVHELSLVDTARLLTGLVMIVGGKSAPLGFETALSAAQKCRALEAFDTSLGRAQIFTGSSRLWVGRDPRFSPFAPVLKWQDLSSDERHAFIPKLGPNKRIAPKLCFDKSSRNCCSLKKTLGILGELPLPLAFDLATSNIQLTCLFHASKDDAH